MYGLSLTFQLLEIINKQSKYLTIQEITEYLINEDLKEFQKKNLKARIYRHLRQLELQKKIIIETRLTEIKTSYLIIKSI